MGVHETHGTPSLASSFSEPRSKGNRRILHLLGCPNTNFIRSHRDPTDPAPMGYSWCSIGAALLSANPTAQNVLLLGA